ncbi:MAG: 3-deoxy-7-phosphoheptulonate synthase [Pseudomonadales bacterium]|nr:3-deoxy-7-phosphoheptulonate synthase [Pseudomonadales bacterium]
MTQQLDNLNVLAQEKLDTPETLTRLLPLPDQSRQFIARARQEIQHIIEAKDSRILVVVGPCSIHDTKAAVEYAQRLKALSLKVDSSLLLIMRAYFEKPRTTTGWKGLINDPYLDDTFKIQDGLKIARQLLLDITEINLPLSTEALDPISPQYLQDLISWSAIGARTTESQTHRELASGLSCPVGFKNGTDGGLTVALNALRSVSSPHRFLGINTQGQVAIFHTRGNSHAHIVLRGGEKGTNYDSNSIAQCEQALSDAELDQNIMVDCSHANSLKNHDNQLKVLKDIAAQINDGNQSIMGLMLESNLHAGQQKITGNKAELQYGVSITDSCLDWQSTETALLQFAETIADKLKDRKTRN